ncbi:MAG: hypothetical protein LC676_09455 [Loktanella sp.]|nr:hypothetical protein [Loktanella sp.]
MRRPVVFGLPAVKKIMVADPAPTTTQPPATPSTGDTTMDANFATNLAKAARAEMPQYADAATWASGLDYLARKAQTPGQTYEQSYLAVAESPDGRAMYRAMQTAANAEMAGISKQRSAAGRPTDRTPTAIVADASESLLAKMATDRAQQDGCSFEIAYGKVVETEEGRELFKAAMAR